MTAMKTIVITGASTGIGEACALYLDSRGFKVLAGVRKSEDGDRLREAASNDLTPILIDVTRCHSIAVASEEVHRQVGETGLHGLVNNAGVSVNAPLEFLSLDDLRMQLEVNLIGQVAVTQALLPLLRRAKGRVVNVGSISGRVASPMFGPYCMSKFGLSAFSDSLRRELRPWGIKVSLVEPGAVATPIWQKSFNRFEDTVKKLPERAHELYGPSMAALRKAAEDMSDAAIPVEEVTKVVASALTVANPRTRYLVGPDAKLMARISWLLPDKILDWLLLKRLGLDKVSA
jgi:NAD(P)-dependent dehydrogenase (short-subunit alcohol dehydrogenase family)